MFDLSKDQIRQAEEFFSSHDCPMRDDSGERYVGAIGGANSYIFTPTGLGVIAEVQCACGQKTNLTDFDEW